MARYFNKLPHVIRKDCLDLKGFFEQVKYISLS